MFMRGDKCVSIYLRSWLRMYTQPYLVMYLITLTILGTVLPTNIESAKNIPFGFD